jgi:hypothetical protein
MRDFNDLCAWFGIVLCTHHRSKRQGGHSCLSECVFFPQPPRGSPQSLRILWSAQTRRVCYDSLSSLFLCRGEDKRLVTQRDGGLTLSNVLLFVYLVPRPLLVAGGRRLLRNYDVLPRRALR